MHGAAIPIGSVRLRLLTSPPPTYLRRLPRGTGPTPWMSCSRGSSVGFAAAAALRPTGNCLRRPTIFLGAPPMPALHATDTKRLRQRQRRATPAGARGPRVLVVG